MLKINTVLINKISSQIANSIQQELYKTENESINIPLGAIFASKYFLGYGPKINIKILPARKCNN